MYTDTPSRIALEKTIRKGLDKQRMGEGPPMVGSFFCSSTTRTLSVRVRGRYEDGWEENNVEPMWKRLMKQVDLETPTQFLDHVSLECTQRECKPDKKVRRHEYKQHV